MYWQAIKYVTHRKGSLLSTSYSNLLRLAKNSSTPSLEISNQNSLSMKSVSEILQIDAKRLSKTLA